MLKFSARASLVCASLLLASGAMAAPAATSAAASAAPKPAATTVSNQLLAAQSQVRFTAKQMGVPMKGLFQQMTGQVQWDAKNPAASQIRIRIPVASITLGAAETDAELRRADWFAADRFPHAEFVVSKIEVLSADKLQVQGQLSIKGVSQTVQTEAKLSRSNGLTTATGSFPMRRLAYQIGLGAWGDTSIVADEVQVQYRIVMRD